MIYIVKHKEYNNPVPKGYKEIGVGDMFKNTGEDIEHLNKHINEATAYFDLWKNTKDKNVGVVHYRRFFADNGKILESKRVTEILKDNDMIVAARYFSPNNLYNELKGELAPGLERELYDKYLNLFYKKDSGFKDYMMNKRNFIPREMMVTTRPVYNKFCKQFFDVVIPVAEKFREEFMNDKEVATKNPRLIGFIVERYFSYLIEKNGFKIYEMEFIEV